MKAIYILFRVILAVCFVPMMYIVIGTFDLLKFKVIVDDLKILLDWLMMNDID